MVARAAIIMHGCTCRYGSWGITGRAAMVETLEDAVYLASIVTTFTRTLCRTLLTEPSEFAKMIHFEGRLQS